MQACLPWLDLCPAPLATLSPRADPCGTPVGSLFFPERPQPTRRSTSMASQLRSSTRGGAAAIADKGRALQGGGVVCEKVGGSVRRQGAWPLGRAHLGYRVRLLRWREQVYFCAASRRQRALNSRGEQKQLGSVWSKPGGSVIRRHDPELHPSRSSKKASSLEAGLHVACWLKPLGWASVLRSGAWRRTACSPCEVAKSCALRSPSAGAGAWFLSRIRILRRRRLSAREKSRGGAPDRCGDNDQNRLLPGWHAADRAPGLSSPGTWRSRKKITSRKDAPPTHAWHSPGSEIHGSLLQHAETGEERPGGDIKKGMRLG